MLSNLMAYGDYWTDPALNVEMLTMTACCLQQICYYRYADGRSPHFTPASRDDVMWQVQTLIRNDTIDWLDLFPPGWGLHTVDDMGGAIADNGVQFTVLFCVAQAENLFIKSHFGTLQQSFGLTTDVYGCRSNVLDCFRRVDKQMFTLPRHNNEPPVPVISSFWLAELEVGPDEARWAEVFRRGPWNESRDTLIDTWFIDLARLSGHALVDDDFVFPQPSWMQMRRYQFDYQALRNLKDCFLAGRPNPMWWAKRVLAYDFLNEPRGDSFVEFLISTDPNAVMPTLYPHSENDEDYSDSGSDVDSDIDDLSGVLSGDEEVVAQT